MIEDNARSHWIPCPICGNRTRTRVYADTVLVKFPLFCPKCRKETRVDVVQLKMVLSGEADILDKDFPINVIIPLRIPRKA